MYVPNFNFKDLSVIQLNSYKSEIITLMTTTLDQIVNESAVRTFANTVQPMIIVDTVIEPLQNIFHYAKSFYPSKEIRETGSNCESEIGKFLIDCATRRDVYDAYKQYGQTTYQTEKDQLTAEERRSFEHAMRGFRRSGLELEKSDYERVIAISKELSDIGIEFDKNVNEEKTSFALTKEQLDGMPESWFTEKNLIFDDVYRVTLKYPDYIPAMEYVKDESIRKILYAAYSSRCSKENTPMFEQAVRLRYEKAKILGYSNHAEYTTEVKIVKNSKNVMDFLNNLNTMFTPIYNKERDELTKFAQNYKLNPLTKKALDPWDKSFYSRVFKEETCQLDMEEVKSYFPLDVVRAGLLNIYQILLGVKFTEIGTDNKWHPSVQLFSVNDTATNELLGYFYLDMYPRDDKYGHAAAFDFQSSCDMTKITGENGRRPTIITMACNFPETGCISFDNVETFFHEFGHVMHQICSRPQLAEFSGFGVEWDFVEAPSQMLEYWCYCPESLQMMSSHKDTNVPIPIEMIDNLNKMKVTLTGFHTKRQLMFGLFDMKVHMLQFEQDTTFNSRKMWYGTVDEVLDYKIPECEQYDYVASFGHLMHGYDAGYYGYLRSESFAANMFYRQFKDGHILDPEIGMRYRKLLLEPGSTKDGMDLLKDFLGEEPNDIYLLMDKGLIVETTTE